MLPKLRVLQLIKTSTGATWALRQVRELVKNGIEIHVALPDGGPLVGRYNRAGATEHLVETDFPISTLWKFKDLKKGFINLVRKIQPDIIHSHFVGSTLTMRLALGRNQTIPRVFQVPGPLHLEHPFFRNAELMTSGSSDYWVGSCRWTCGRYIKSGISPKKVFLSYYGTDIDLFSPRTPGALRRELGLGPKHKIVGMVSYMYAPKRYLGQSRGLKGHEDLIDSIRICLKSDPQIRGVIVGGPWNGAIKYEKRVRNYARKCCGDKIIFLGTRQDVAELYADFDVAVHPSHSENVGGAVESLLLGVPTIATRVGGFPDLIENGKTGWLVPSKDPNELAGAIKRCLRDPINAMETALAGQALARRLFDVKKTASDIKKIYEQILAGL